VDALLLFVFAITAFVIAFLFFPVQIKLMTKWQLFDLPTNHKIHARTTPSMGGVCILLGVVFTLLIALPLSQWAQLKFFFVALAIIFTTGLRDDILTLKPHQKLLGQFLPIIIAVVFGNVSLSSFYEIWPVTFPTWISWCVTVFTIVILTNAFNLIDGIDGLAGTVSAIVLGALGIWFFRTSNNDLAVVSLVFAGAIIAFLFYNWQPSEIFMGDTGTLSIGFVLSFLIIQFININFQLPAASPNKFAASISAAACVLIIPIFDTSRVIILRLRRWESPFKADRNHLHHQFLNLGFSHRKTTLVLGAINLGFVGLAIALRNQPDVLILPIVLVVCLAINFWLKAAQRNQSNNETKNTGPEGGN
jgi:UDP-N-acetylmuramyl pentapeptide phosphotransferase/UDP-N-acetylglucosamine-1-phosphate transferase